MLRSAQQLSLSDKAFQPCPQDRVTVHNLLQAADRQAKDALIAQNSFDTRVEANYDACYNMALAVLNAQGWKSKALAGHHAFVLEAACCAIGAGEGLYDRLDAVREVRNQKYSGTSRTQRDLEASAKVLDAFSQLAAQWLAATHPQLLK